MSKRDKTLGIALFIILWLIMMGIIIVSIVNA